MIDIILLRKNPELFKVGVQKKGAKVDIDKILK